MDITDSKVNDFYGVTGDVEFMAYNMGKTLLKDKGRIYKSSRWIYCNSTLSLGLMASHHIFEKLVFCSTINTELSLVIAS